MEIFKDIIGYEGFYKISNYGNVYSIRSGRILSKIEHNKGYIYYNLYLNRKCTKHYAHRLVAMHFLEKSEYDQVNHIDMNKKNNNVKNLEWCSSLQNIRHSLDYINSKKPKCENHPKSKYTNKEIHLICSELEKDIVRNVSEKLNYPSRLVQSIYKKERWVFISKDYNFLEYDRSKNNPNRKSDKS